MPDSFRGWGPLLYGPPVTRHVHVADICQLLDHQIGRSHGRRTFRSNGSETASASRPRWRCPPRRPPHRTSLRQLRAEAMRYQGYASDKLSALFRPARATTSLKPTESSQGPAVLEIRGVARATSAVARVLSCFPPDRRPTRNGRSRSLRVSDRSGHLQTRAQRG